MEPRVKQVKTKKDYTLILTFNNREVRNFDMAPYLNRGVFKLLKDWSHFRRAKVMFGTVVWPGDIDIAPETLYQDSIPLP
ncbi:MAG: DUF2442 domain-containing protein [Deltaproteobacteria bacterium]|nr:DUF2442 domain-containing protein [Deltaproteobacteria bacterium]